MSLDQIQIRKLIEKSGLVAEDDLKTAQSTAKHLNCSVSDVLIGRGFISEKAYREILSENFSVKAVNLREFQIPFETINLIPETMALERGVVIFLKLDNQISVALEDPHDLETIELVRKTIGSGIKILPFLALSKEIKEACRFYRRKSLSEEDTEETTPTKEIEVSAVASLEQILEDAVREEASDIHLEPLANQVLVRFRIDGVLHDQQAFPFKMHAPLVARTKILSDLKLDEHRHPQDGRFSFKTKSGEKISLRVSIIPTVFGEKVVLRILEDMLTKFNLEDLGILPEDQETAGKILERTHGMFLITGPTGSGKTTTLYTLLGLMNKPGVNIVTIEDPVENRIRRINQTQVNPQINLNFAGGLRSILRQDPDIIMVGEIRDNETAVIAVNAAMTGHLVFSSVHANNASGAIPRMIDLGVEPFLLASVLNMVAAQRLVRILCPKCRYEMPLSPVIEKRLGEAKEFLTPDVRSLLTTNYASKGCPECNQTGFRHRMGIFELINLDEEIKEMIVKKASAGEIRSVVRKKGAKTMLEDGIIKVSKGITTLEEVFRVISE